MALPKSGNKLSNTVLRGYMIHSNHSLILKNSISGEDFRDSLHGIRFRTEGESSIDVSTTKLD